MTESTEDSSFIQTSKTFVKVLYDYQYTDDDNEVVTIHKGEEYRLLKKASDDWWHVGKTDANLKFYVPATYVKEIFKNVITVGENKLKPRNSYSDYDPKLDSGPPDIEPASPSPGSSEEASIESGSHTKRHSNGPVSPSPEYANLEEIQKTIISVSINGGDDSSQDNRPPSPMYSNVQEWKVQVEEQSTESHEEMKPAVNTATLNPAAEPGTSSEWEALADESGRCYYYNTSTGQTTWTRPSRVKSKRRPAPKPPGFINKLSKTAEGGSAGKELLQRSDSQSSSVPSSPDSHLHHMTSPPISPASPGGGGGGNVKYGSLTRGWRQKINETGEICYVNGKNTDKWLSSVDEEGRIYYFQDSSNESAWTLPSLGGPESPTTAEFEKVRPLMCEATRSMSAGTTDALLKREIRSATLPSIYDPTPGSPRLNNKHVTNVSNTNKASTLPMAGKLTDKGGGDAGSRQNFVDYHDEELSLKIGHGPSLRNKNNQPPPKIIEKSGFLNKTKYQDGSGKKVKKNWSQTFVKLTAAKLLFYKNNTSALPSSNKPYGKPEVALDLSSITIQWADKEISTKKNIIQASGYDGNGLAYYLLQSEDNTRIHTWFSAITQAIGLQTDRSSPKIRPNRVSIRPTDELHDAPYRPPIIPVNKKAQGRYVLNEDIPEIDREKSTKIRERLVKFFRKRPTLENLQQQGIIREEAVFGAHIQAICDREKRHVPVFITQCISAIEAKKGLETDGIYRISGNLAQVQKLRFIIDQDENFVMSPTEWDLHVLTGALKLFFRELKEPIFPFQFFDKFLSASSIAEKGKSIKAIRDLVNVLPKPNYETLKVIFTHLNLVVQNSSLNRMQSQNIAIVFGPTLLWPEKESTNMAVSMMCQNNLVECILSDFDKVFKK